MEEAGPEEDHVHDQHLNEQVLYDVSAGPRNHGRLAIGNGAIRVADVRAAAKERRVHPSNPVSVQSMAREMARLRSANARLQQENHEKDNALQHYKVTTELTLDLYRALGKEIPENALQRLSAAQAIATGSSHVGSESTNNSMDADGHDGEGLGRAHMDDNNHHSGNNACV
ncbi:unnamed protein product [Urochloa decumbens]|uniref:Uncharacterized protein n=1 Tax=Urochloa decumbens TaxID=240449 RepID=A0ABC9F1J1_9POAL